MDLNLIKDIIVVIGTFIALVTLIKGVWEYSKNNAMKRAEYFNELNRELYKIVIEPKMGELLEKDSDELKSVPYDKKFEFLSFFEKVALMVNTGLLTKKVAHYMFAYYAIRCDGSVNFWKGNNNDINKDSFYWSLFRSFASDMNAIEQKVKKTPKNKWKTSKLRF